MAKRGVQSGGGAAGGAGTARSICSEGGGRGAAWRVLRASVGTGANA